MYKEYLVKNGNSLIMWINDVVIPGRIGDLCRTKKCEEILKRAVEGGFDSIEDDEAKTLFADCIEPVTYGDIDIMAKDRFYIQIKNACGILWTEAPEELKRDLYGN